MSTISLATAKHKQDVFRCPDCPKKYTAIQLLYDHVGEDHGDRIPDNVTIRQYIFNRKYKKTHGSCVICKKTTKWMEDRVKYARYCSDACKKVAREKFRKNAMARLGTDNPASTPEHQINAIKGRNYSGEYTWRDGTVIGYSSSYEMDFLRFLDEDMNFPSSEVEQCELIFEFEFDNKVRFHIPDYHIKSYNLIIQIKTFKNMNSHVQTTGKIRQKLSDEAIIKSGQYNYIMILDKEYHDFVDIMKVLKDRSLSNNPDNSMIICIPKY